MQINKRNIITISEKYLESLKSEKDKYIMARSSKLQDGVVLDIIGKIKTNFKLQNNEEAVTILAMLFQQGGTARSCDGNMTVKILDTEVKLSSIRKILKDCSCNRGERKLARSLADEIQAISLVLNLPGNLSNKIQKKDVSRTFSMEEKVWLSDFQSDNENCPTELRTLILETFKKSDSQNKKK